MPIFPAQGERQGRVFTSWPACSGSSAAKRGGDCPAPQRAKNSGSLRQAGVQRRERCALEEGSAPQTKHPAAFSATRRSAALRKESPPNPRSVAAPFFSTVVAHRIQVSRKAPAGNIASPSSPRGSRCRYSGARCCEESRAQRVCRRRRRAHGREQVRAVVAAAGLAR